MYYALQTNEAARHEREGNNSSEIFALVFLKNLHNETVISFKFVVGLLNFTAALNETCAIKQNKVH